MSKRDLDAILPASNDDLSDEYEIVDESDDETIQEPSVEKLQKHSKKIKKSHKENKLEKQKHLSRKSGIVTENDSSDTTPKEMGALHDVDIKKYVMAPAQPILVKNQPIKPLNTDQSVMRYENESNTKKSLSLKEHFIINKKSYLTTFLVIILFCICSYVMYRYFKQKFMISYDPVTEIMKPNETMVVPINKLSDEQKL